MSKLAVIGAGPAGMMAALTAAKNKNAVDLYDSNEKLGKKLYITGKGRCNLTNACEQHDFLDAIVHNHRFLYSALHKFSNQDFMALMEEMGVPLKIERGNRVFPASDKSSDVIRGFKQALEDQKCRIYLNKKIVDFIIEEKPEGSEIKGIVLENGESRDYDRVILASGGKSYASTGSDGNLFAILKKYHHKITPLKPGLVPVNTKEAWPRELQGLALKNVMLTLNKKDRSKVKSLLGEMLFTHFGVSGPLVLSLSSYISGKPEDYFFSLDLKPALSMAQMEDRIQRDFQKYANKNFGNALTDLLPSKMIPIMVKLSKIDANLKVNQMTKEQRKNLLQCFKSLDISIADLREFSEAIITIGGVDVREIDPKTMASKMVKGLYFAGEILDVDALTGGFNIQIAASTGYLAGNAITN